LKPIFPETSFVRQGFLPATIRFSRTIVVGTILSLGAFLPLKQALASSDAQTLSWTLNISDQKGSAKPVTQTITYHITPNMMRIDQTTASGSQIFIWRTDAGLVYAIDPEKKTYHQDTLDHVLSYQSMSDLLGKHSGKNPGDKILEKPHTEMVSGIACTDEKLLHKFRGVVVGMINGDQTIEICRTQTIPGIEILKSFQKNLVLLDRKIDKKEIRQDESTTISLLVHKETAYKAGFISRMLNAIGLYDLSKVPATEVEDSRISNVKVEPESTSQFNLPDGLKRVFLPAGPGPH
jgi:hypothetical protein